MEDNAARQARLVAALLALVVLVLLLRRRPHPVRVARRDVSTAVQAGEDALVRALGVDESASVAADLAVDAAVSGLGLADRRRRRRHG